MSTEHILLAAGDDGERWVILLRDHTDRWNVFSNARTSLEARVAFLIETMQTRPGADLTFSTRPLAQVQAAGLIVDADAVRGALRRVSLSIMAPAGTYVGNRGEVIAYPPSLWGTAWRDPRGGLSAGHRDTRFREQVLLEVVRDWFSKQNYESFRPEPSRQRADLQRIPRPGFARELLVRHDWQISAVVAEAPPRASPVQNYKTAPGVNS